MMSAVCDKQCARVCAYIALLVLRVQVGDLLHLLFRNINVAALARLEQPLLRHSALKDPYANFKRN